MHLVCNCVYVYDAILVISKVLKGNHMVGNCHLTVAPYYECLGPVPLGSGTEPCWRPPAITVHFDPSIVQFVVQTDAIRSRIEASLNDVSPGCTITWPDSTASGCGTVEIAFTGANSGISGMTISKMCKDRLAELLDMIESENVDILQEIWPGFVEQWEKQFSEADKSVLVRLDCDKCSVHVISERQKCREMVEKLTALRSELVDEIQRRKMRISERVSDISPHKLSLLRSCGFFHTESDAGPATRVVDDVIVIEGQPDKVIDWKMKMYQMLASAHSETVHVDEYVVDALSREPFRCHLDQLLQQITGVIWYTAGKEIEVFGENRDKVSHLIYVGSTEHSFLIFIRLSLFKLHSKHPFWIRIPFVLFSTGNNNVLNVVLLTRNNNLINDGDDDDISLAHSHFIAEAVFNFNPVHFVPCDLQTLTSRLITTSIFVIMYILYIQRGPKN